MPYTKRLHQSELGPPPSGRMRLCVEVEGMLDGNEPHTSSGCVDDRFGIGANASAQEGDARRAKRDGQGTRLLVRERRRL